MLIRLLFSLVLLGLGLAIYAFYFSAPPPPPPPPPRPAQPAPPTDSPSLPPPSTSIPTTFPSDLPTPAPDYTPAEVVRTIVAALRDNDSPTPQSGVATTFNFASPDNQRATGPLPRFITMVNSPAYSPMLNHRRATFAPLTTTPPTPTSPPTAQQLVTFYDADDNPSYFLFSLSLQTTGQLQNCWLTDAVLRLTPPQAEQLQPKPPTPPAKGL